MFTRRNLAFFLVLGLISLSIPTTMVSAEGGRYFIRSNSSFWKNAFGVRNSFDDGFTADISDIQVRLAKVFGVSVIPVKVFQILPDPTVSQSDQEADSLQALQPKAIKSKDGSVRYTPSNQISWGIQTVYGDTKIASTSGGNGIKVAVLDTGALTTHPDLKSRIGECEDFTSPRFAIVDNKCDDKNGHGTHVAGIIAADAGDDHLGIYGVAPMSSILAYKVCNDNGSCYSDDIANAIRTATDHGANIINMSFGSSAQSSLIGDAINYAVSKNVLLVAAAGNEGPFPGSIDYPAANISVIAVGALTSSLGVADWSSRGFNDTTEPYTVNEGDIEFAAPGKTIESTANNNSYIVLSGTSMAAPFVSGLAAKFWQSNDKNPANATREVLHSMASDIFPDGDDPASGWGLPSIQ